MTTATSTSWWVLKRLACTQQLRNKEREGMVGISPCHCVCCLQVACMQFINIVVHSVENMNFRVHLQYEFTHLKLDEYLEVSVLKIWTRRLQSSLFNYAFSCLVTACSQLLSVSRSPSKTVTELNIREHVAL